MAGALPLRAEEMSYDLFQSLHERGYLEYSNYIAEKMEDSNVIGILAQKGGGKTANIYGAFRILMENDKEDFCSGIHFDPVSGEIDTYPAIYVPEKRRKEIPLSEKELIKDSNIISVDNFHYLLDFIKRAYLSGDRVAKRIGEEVVDTLSIATLEEIDDGKKIIIPSENSLNFSTLFVDSENFKELSEKIEEEIRMLPPDFNSLCYAYNVGTDEIVEDMWKRYSDKTPRSFVNMVNRFGKKKSDRYIITWEGIAKKYRVYEKFIRLQEMKIL